MFDDFLFDPGSRSPYLKKQMRLCYDNAWKGVQIYLKATCSLIPALPPPAALKATAMEMHTSNLPVGGEDLLNASFQGSYIHKSTGYAFAAPGGYSN